MRIYSRTLPLYSDYDDVLILFSRQQCVASSRSYSVVGASAARLTNPVQRRRPGSSSAAKAASPSYFDCHGRGGSNRSCRCLRSCSARPVRRTSSSASGSSDSGCNATAAATDDDERSPGCCSCYSPRMHQLCPSDC